MSHLIYEVFVMNCIVLRFNLFRRDPLDVSDSDEEEKFLKYSDSKFALPNGYRSSDDSPKVRFICSYLNWEILINEI